MCVCRSEHTHDDLNPVPCVCVCRQIMYQLFTAVEHLHVHHVVHRDLKVMCDLRYLVCCGGKM